MNRNSNNAKTITSNGVKDISELCAINLQCLEVNNSFAGARFTVLFGEGSAEDSLQGFSSTSRTSFVHDQGQSCSYASTDPNYKYDRVSSTSYEKIVPMAQGTNPSLVDFQKALHNVDTSRVTPIKVDFTNIVLHCPVQNTFNTVVYLQDIKPNKGGAFFYYFQYLDCMEMCYFANYQIW